MILNRQNILLIWFGEHFLHFLAILKEKNKNMNVELFWFFPYSSGFKLSY